MVLFCRIMFGRIDDQQGVYSYFLWRRVVASRSTEAVSHDPGLLLLSRSSPCDSIEHEVVTF